MKFGKTLQDSVYPPWRDQYIDYNKLKGLLREAKVDGKDGAEWTEEDEKRFCDEVFNVQLEKVTKFQEATFHSIRDRVNAAFDTLRELAPTNNEQAEGEEDGKVEDAGEAAEDGEAQKKRLREVEAELDAITRDIRELKSFTSINYTGFQKIVKKHDRKRGDRYKVRPMMQVTMSNRPFTTEPAYSPLLKKLSMMYFIIRQRLEEGDASGKVPSVPVDLENQGEVYNGERYKAYKFWIHPDNLLEVKTYILPRLPALVYSTQTSKDENSSEDPTITSLYFDNPKFDLYRAKVDRKSTASSVRVRWHGQLKSGPSLTLEKKTIDESGASSELKIPIKGKYILPFLRGEYKMEKSIAKMERQGQFAEAIASFKDTVDKLHSFIQEHNVSPVMRANYARMAFQKPGDDRIRISIDSDVAFIREDTLDARRPCRDRDEWHRTDIDEHGMSYPFRNIRVGEVSKFPYSILEIKIRGDGNRKRPAWVEELMASHLVHPAPKFSKFVHGVATLFDDYVNTLPFWMSDLEADIRKDPREAFEQEAERRAEMAKDDQVVGSYLGRRGSSFRPSKSSPAAQSYLAERMSGEVQRRRASSVVLGAADELQPDEEAEQEQGLVDGAGDGSRPRNYGTISSVLPSFSLKRYARARRGAEETLPEGVVKPREWIKNRGELKIEPKVWLANERTFLKWQHISILMGSLAVALFAAAGKGSVGRIMGVFYVLVAGFANYWGHRMLRTRRAMIVERSGKDFDNMVGPILVSGALVVGLVLNLSLQWKERLDQLGNGLLGDATEL